jgi:hypothetical protein
MRDTIVSLDTTMETGTPTAGNGQETRLMSLRGIMPRLWLIAAFAAVIGLYVAHSLSASLLIDGVRWFWLDDDQMISMRYARNLAEGNGLVWNLGERVEGYTNFGLFPTV